MIDVIHHVIERFIRFYDTSRTTEVNMGKGAEGRRLVADWKLQLRVFTCSVEG